MPSYAELEQEAAWRAEVVPDAIKWFIAEAIAHWKLSPGALGCKGNNLHLRGAHRSRRWIKTSRYCTNTTYTASHPDDLAGDENWCVGIDITLPTSVLLAACKRLDAAVRAGLIEEVSEWYGNTDGDDRVDGYNNIANRVATSDSSHLWHLHITIKRRFANTLAVLQRLFAILTGEGDTMFCNKGDKGEAVRRLQLALNRLEQAAVGKDAVTVDNSYGASTSAAVKRILGGTGDNFNAELSLRLEEKLVRLWSTGLPGPAGPAGPQGPAGEAGTPGRDGVVPDGAVFVLQSPPAQG